MAHVIRCQKELCWKCFSRNQSTLTAHHIVPRRARGRTVPENLAPLCERCHTAYHLYEEMMVGRVYNYKAVFFKWLNKGVDEDEINRKRVERVMRRNLRIKEKRAIGNY